MEYYVNIDDQVFGLRQNTSHKQDKGNHTFRPSTHARGACINQINKKWLSRRCNWNVSCKFVTISLTNLVTIQVRWKIRLAAIRALAIRSQRFCTCPDCTAMQNFVSITIKIYMQAKRTYRGIWIVRETLWAKWIQVGRRNKTTPSCLYIGFLIK